MPRFVRHTFLAVPKKLMYWRLRSHISMLVGVRQQSCSNVKGDEFVTRLE